MILMGQSIRHIWVYLSFFIKSSKIGIRIPGKSDLSFTMVQLLFILSVCLSVVVVTFDFG